MRARLAIAISGFSCHLREVVLRSKPDAMLAASPKATVPILVLPTGEVIDESLDIMRHVLASNDPDNWQRSETGGPGIDEDLITRCDGPFKRTLDRYKYPSRYPKEGIDRDEQRAFGAAFLDELNRRLEQTHHLSGAAMGFTDAAIFPFVRQFANTDRAWFDEQPYPALQAWLAHHLDSDLFATIIGKYPAWAPGDEEPIFPEAAHTKWGQTRKYRCS